MAYGFYPKKAKKRSIFHITFESLAPTGMKIPLVTSPTMSHVLGTNNPSPPWRHKLCIPTDSEKQIFVPKLFFAEYLQIWKAQMIE